ncbi:MAG: peptidoglycan DD-metalloendopeptidase family protein [Rhizobiales bacterium]|nr:peptidoglycan DD-metalloendopeptidase family protein [Hyphomicrobiales bacterium]
MAGLLAACGSDASKFGIPSITGSTNGQKAMVGGPQPMPPEPVGAQPAPYTPPVQRADIPAQQVLPGVAPTAAASAAASKAVAAGKGAWSTVGGQVVTLGQGETLSSLSRRYGVPVKELAAANGIADPSQVVAGMRITVPTYGAATAGAKAAVDPKQVAAAPAEAAPLGGVHVVTPGQTINSIARLYNVSPTQLAAANDMASGKPLEVGQKLKIPGHTEGGAVATLPEPARREEQAKGDGSADPKVAGAPSAATSPETTASISPNAAADAAKEMAGAAEAPQATAYAPTDPGKSVADNDPGSANGTSFRWPVRGRIIGSFGTSPTGEKNDGINLAVPEGTSIKAVEAGTVIYAGNELEGYGQLVLIRHADGWVSAYAHNSQILVKRGDTVRRGQIISRAGTSGSVSAPQLHFELRKGSKPVNPLDYLQS